MEETANLLEKGEKFVLKNIEKRLGNLESTMQEVLARGDQFNEETQKKLEAIQDEIEKQSTNMRKLRRNLMSHYSPTTVFGIAIVLFLVWLFIVYYVMRDQ